MNKKTSTIIFVIIILILVGVIVWQYKNSKPKEGKQVTSQANIETNNTPEKSLGKETATPTPETFKKVTVPAKDTEALRSNFTYEVPLSKILDRKWEWVESVNYDDTIFTPKKSNVFSLTFKKDGTFSGTTDCNGIFGKYTVKGSSIKLSSIGQTEMFCEGSEEIKFTTYLGQVVGFMFNGDGNLVLNLEFSSGSMVFK